MMVVVVECRMKSESGWRGLYNYTERGVCIITDCLIT